MLRVVSNLSTPEETFFSSIKIVFRFFFFLNFCLSVEEDGSMNKRRGLITCNERLG